MTFGIVTLVQWNAVFEGALLGVVFVWWSSDLYAIELMVGARSLDRSPFSYIHS
jgi:hypothetical protein